MPGSSSIASSVGPEMIHPPLPSFGLGARDMACHGTHGRPVNLLGDRADSGVVTG